MNLKKITCKAWRFCIDIVLSEKMYNIWVKFWKIEQSFLQIMIFSF
jgi:hypothetical protein